MAELALSVNDRVVSRARQYAKRRGVSLSNLVEAYLAAIAEPPSPASGAASILRSVRGVLRNAVIGHYRTHRAQKYR
jgi:hypothetical protein